ncbi:MULTISPECIES: hypothetical protein [Enterobacter]|nr:hypothetical protein [Enterobacter genomosp. S]
MSEIEAAGGEAIALAMDVTDPASILYVLQAPEHVDVAELFIMPTEQPW